ncbi:MAG: hypothetical protein ABSH31_11515 [Bryobacteraceae bacterium]
MSSPRNRKGRDALLLLTAAMDPGGMVYVLRMDPKERAKDYEWALRKWLKSKWAGSILLCENTGADLTFLAKTARSEDGQRLTLHSFQGNSYPRHLGKGFGEMNIIREALSMLPGPLPGLVVKVSGRYYVRNLMQILRAVNRREPADLYCTMYGSPWVIGDSRLLIATPEFLQRFLIPLQDRINDSEMIHFEHAVAQAAIQAMASGLKWAPLPYTPIVEGISGTVNAPLKTKRASARYSVELTLDFLGLGRYRPKVVDTLKL